MGKSCFGCKNNIKKFMGDIYFPKDRLKSELNDMNIFDSIVNEMNEKDMLCEKCGKKVYYRHAADIYNYYKAKLMPDEFEALMKSEQDWIPIAKAELGISSQIQKSSDDNNQKHVAPTNNITLDKITTMDDLTRLIQSRHDMTKAKWNKNGVIQFKDEHIAILQRTWGAQVQFIIACSQITSEGYRLMAIDEGKEGGSSGFTGGINAYFYFQKIDYVR